MEKIIFGTHEFELVPVGIAANDMIKRRSFKFTTDLSYPDVEEILIDPENFATIQYAVESGDVVATYADCVALKTLAKDIETGVYTAEYSTDEMARRVSELEVEVKLLKEGR